MKRSKIILQSSIKLASSIGILYLFIKFAIRAVDEKNVDSVDKLLHYGAALSLLYLSVYVTVFAFASLFDLITSLKKTH